MQEAHDLLCRSLAILDTPKFWTGRSCLRAHGRLAEVLADPDRPDEGMQDALLAISGQENRVGVLHAGYLDAVKKKARCYCQYRDLDNALKHYEQCRSG